MATTMHPPGGRDRYATAEQHRYGDGIALCHVAIETTYLHQQSGTGRYLSAIVSELGRRPDVQLIPLAAPRLRFGPRSIRRVLNGILHLIWSQLALPALLARTEADVVHTSMVAPIFAPCPVIVTIHDAVDAMPDLRASSLWSRYVRLIGVPAARRADAVVTVSRAAAADITHHYRLDSNKIRVVPNGTWVHELTPTPPRSQPSSSAPFVLAIGPNQRRKNLNTLVDAVERVRSEGQTDLQLVLVGRGTERLAVNRDWLLTLEHVSDAELAWLYQRAAVVAVPSLYEGFGLPVLESLAMGTPVVASDIPALREIGGDAARYADPARPDSFVESLQQVLCDPDGERRRIEETRDDARKRTWGQVAEELTAIYVQLGSRNQ